ncbi:MAG: aspartate 1-decarboxylase [Candidatus Kapaibacteriota bacterium]|jgi:aspartate 1-decarboxylase
MQRIFLKSKIHRATITQADLNYEGSITIDEDLIDAADLKEYEKVSIVNNNNGERFETYVIKGERGSGVIGLNGAAARKGMNGDILIIISYCILDDKTDSNEIDNHEVIKVFVDNKNAIKEVVKGN